MSGPIRQKRDGGRTAVLITKCTPELRRAIEADARARGITIGRAMVERMTAGLSHGMCDECAARAKKGENP